MQANVERTIEMYNHISVNPEQPKNRTQPIALANLSSPENVIKGLSRMCNSDENANFLQSFVEQVWLLCKMVAKEKRYIEIMKEQEIQIK